jgi:hypothetical protein
MLQCLAGAGLSYMAGQRLSSTKISVAGKNSSGQESSLDISRSSCKVERHVDNSRSIVNHRFSDIGLVAHRHSYQGAAACDYNEVGRRELSRCLPYSNRVQRLKMRILALQRRTVGLFLEGFAWEETCFTNFTNYSAFIYPG